MRKLFGVAALLLGLGILGVLVVREIGSNVAAASGQQDTLAYVHHEVINQTLNEYELAVRDGSPVDRCVRAGMVAEAYLQANDEEGYKQWKKNEHRDCKAAGNFLN